MLQITVPGVEMWDERTERFVSSKEQTLQLEHSLISLSKWESKRCKPFYSDKGKTAEETLDYIKCMTITPNVSDEVYYCLTPENHKDIQDYIEAPMTATIVNTPSKGKGKKRIITSELIYHWMIELSIPFECQKWHLNRLLMLIQVREAENQPKTKKTRKNQMDYLSKMDAINNARRQKLGSKG